MAILTTAIVAGYAAALAIGACGIALMAYVERLDDRER